MRYYIDLVTTEIIVKDEAGAEIKRIYLPPDIPLSRWRERLAQR